MAIRLIDRYPTRVDAASTDYPHGKGRNKSAPDAVDGTPYDMDRYNDHEALFQALVEAAGITPSGTVDTVPSSQYMDSLVQVANGFTEIDVAGDQDVTLDYNQGRIAGLRLTGALAGDVDVVVPDTARSYVVINESTGSFNVALRTAAGAGVNVPRAGVIALSCDGTDVQLPHNVEYSRRQVDVALAGTDVTLSASEAVAGVINLTGTLTASVSLIVPDTARKYTIVNSTSGAFTVTVKTAAGTGVVVPQGQTRVLRSDGADVVDGLQVDSGQVFLGSSSMLSAFNSQLLAGNGYKVIPSGDDSPDAVIQWGLTSPVAAGGEVTVTFPIAFPNDCHSVTANITLSQNSTTPVGVAVSLLQPTSVILRNRSSVSAAIYWQAAGH